MLRAVSSALGSSGRRRLAPRASFNQLPCALAAESNDDAHRQQRADKRAQRNKGRKTVAQPTNEGVCSLACSLNGSRLLQKTS